MEDIREYNKKGGEVFEKGELSKANEGRVASKESFNMCLIDEASLGRP
jgi:hypothetical protein